MNKKVYRFDDQESLWSNLDPIQDILNFVAVLKSKEYTKELLKKKHWFNSGKELEETAKLIGLHSEIAIWLAKQALGWPYETSFLPLYYSCLNLFKIYLLILWKRKELEKNKQHWASYDNNQMKKKFLNEEIILQKHGTIPLIYETLLGKKIRAKQSIKLEKFYSCITSIAWEYVSIVWKETNIFYHNTSIIRDDDNWHYIKITPSIAWNQPSVRKLKAYNDIRLIEEWWKKVFIWKRIMGNYDDVSEEILDQINRNLLNPFYDPSAPYWMNWHNCLTVNNCDYVASEEIAILISYFHLSNVVRYNPEHLSKLMDSKYWAIILWLRTHWYYRFLGLMWWNFNKQCFHI